jgi:hypothetical protein
MPYTTLCIAYTPFLSFHTVNTIGQSSSIAVALLFSLFLLYTLALLLLLLLLPFLGHARKKLHDLLPEAGVTWSKSFARASSATACQEPLLVLAPL